MRKADFEELKESLTEAVAHAQGQPVRGLRVHQVEVETIDVVAVRKRLDLTQAAFAQLIETPVATLRKWEQKTRRPTGPARTLLRIFDRNPDAARAFLEEPVAGKAATAVAGGKVHRR
jgi:putative transcriptional regulator